VTDRNAGIVYKISPVPITIETILTFFDQSVADGTLTGNVSVNLTPSSQEPRVMA
jgi:hypothetical protein